MNFIRLCGKWILIIKEREKKILLNNQRINFSSGKTSLTVIAVSTPPENAPPDQPN